MTTAAFTIENGSIIMDVKGHAGFAELGKDPVCAGASVLAMTCAQCVMGLWQAGALRKKPRVRVENGRVLVVAKPKEGKQPTVRYPFWVAETGFRLLEESYPAAVQVKKSEPAEAVSIEESSTLRTE